MIDDLDMSLGHPERDCETTLEAFPTDRLTALLAALMDDRLIRGEYHDAQGRGCILNVLDPAIDSKNRLLAYPFATEEVRLAARRLVRYWDQSILTEPTLRALLVRVIAARSVRRTPVTLAR